MPRVYYSLFPLAPQECNPERRRFIVCNFLQVIYPGQGNSGSEAFPKNTGDLHWRPSMSGTIIYHMAP